MPKDLVPWEYFSEWRKSNFFFDTDSIFNYYRTKRTQIHYSLQNIIIGMHWLWKVLRERKIDVGVFEIKKIQAIYVKVYLGIWKNENCTKGWQQFTFKMMNLLVKNLGREPIFVFWEQACFVICTILKSV